MVKLLVQNVPKWSKKIIFLFDTFRKKQIKHWLFMVLRTSNLYSTDLFTNRFDISSVAINFKQKPIKPFWMLLSFALRVLCRKKLLVCKHPDSFLHQTPQLWRVKAFKRNKPTKHCPLSIVICVYVLWSLLPAGSWMSDKSYPGVYSRGGLSS